MSRDEGELESGVRQIHNEGSHRRITYGDFAGMIDSEPPRYGSQSKRSFLHKLLPDGLVVTSEVEHSRTEKPRPPDGRRRSGPR